MQLIQRDQPWNWLLSAWMVGCLWGAWETQFEDGAVKKITLLSAPEVPQVVKLGSRDWEFPLFFFWQKKWVRTIRTKNSIPYVNCDICCHFTGLGLQGESAEAIPAKWGISAGPKETRVPSSALPVAHRPRAGHPRLWFPPLPISECLSSKTVHTSFSYHGQWLSDSRE